jgi:hypothetical protein
MKENFVRSALRSAWAALSVVALASAVGGCKPRGESHTLETILSDARSGYQLVSTQPAGEAASTLNQLATALDKLAGLGGGGDARQLSAEVADTLSGLLTKVGFTVRPGLTELINQYRVVAAEPASAVRIGDGRMKLLVSRTYTALASERATTNFGL